MSDTVNIFVGNNRIRSLPQAIHCTPSIRLSHAAAKSPTVYSYSVNLVLCTVVLGVSICQSCEILFQHQSMSEFRCGSGNLNTKSIHWRPCSTPCPLICRLGQAYEQILHTSLHIFDTFFTTTLIHTIACKRQDWQWTGEQSDRLCWCPETKRGIRRELRLGFIGQQPVADSYMSSCSVALWWHPASTMDVRCRDYLCRANVF